MADEQAVIKRMEQYAKAAARKVLQKFGLGQDENRHEDISQTLFLAGWEVWRDGQRILPCDIGGAWSPTVLRDPGENCIVLVYPFTDTPMTDGGGAARAKVLGIDSGHCEELGDIAFDLYGPKGLRQRQVSALARTSTGVVLALGESAGGLRLMAAGAGWSR